MDERTLLVIVREEEGEGTNVRNEKKMGKGCPLCAEECVVHSIVIRRLLFKPDEARRAPAGDNSKSDSKAAAREGEEQAGGQNAPEIDHMGHARSGKEREVENSAPLSFFSTGLG